MTCSDDDPRMDTWEKLPMPPAPPDLDSGLLFQDLAHVHDLALELEPVDDGEKHGGKLEVHVPGLQSRRLLDRRDHHVVELQRPIFACRALPALRRDHHLLQLGEIYATVSTGLIFAFGGLVLSEQRFLRIDCKGLRSKTRRFAAADGGLDRQKNEYE